MLMPFVGWFNIIMVTDFQVYLFIIIIIIIITTIETGVVENTRHVFTALR